MRSVCWRWISERSEAGLEFRQEHVLVRLFGSCADSGQAVAGQRQAGQGRKMQVSHEALSCQHLVTPQPEPPRADCWNSWILQMIRAMRI